jgi:hypothetical protein
MTLTSLPELHPTKLGPLLAEFPGDQFYVSDEGARHAVTSGGQFKIILRRST